MSELKRNHLLCGARLRMPSQTAPGDHASRAEIAEAVNAWLWDTTGKRYDLDAHYLAKLERGVVRWPNAAYRSGLRHVLGVETDVELGFHSSHRPEEYPPAPVMHPHLRWETGVVIDQAVAITDDDLMPANRRTVLTSAVPLTGAALSGVLEPFLRPITMMASSRGSAFTHAELDAAERLTASLRSWHAHPGTLARETVVAQLGAHVRRLRQAPQETSETRRGFRIGAELAGIAASMSWDATHYHAAQRYFVLAVQLGHAARDDALAAVALAALARQCFDLGRPHDGLDVVQLAQYGTRRTATPRLRALLATREAWAYAHLADARAFQRTVRLAEDFYAEGDHDADRATPTVRALDTAELYGVLGARYRDLALADPRHARTAQVYIDRALSLRHPSRRRNRTFDLIGLARTYLISREPDRATELINEAMALAGPWTSGRVGIKLRDFRREATPFATVPAVREARDAIAELAHA